MILTIKKLKSNNMNIVFVLIIINEVNVRCLAASFVARLACVICGKAENFHRALCERTFSVSNFICLSQPECYRIYN